MRYTKDHKVKSRNKILSSALKLFANRGFDNISIDEIMADASMTRGAFYAHFKSKQELYSEAIRSAVCENGEQVPNLTDGKSQLKQLVSDYLDADYSDPEVLPCPLAYLVADVVNREPEVRSAYAKSYQSLNSKIKHLMSVGGSFIEDETILALTSMMIGSVAIARTIPDPTTTKKLLGGCKKTVFRLIDAA